jgi:hypothetical protein
MMKRGEFTQRTVSVEQLIENRARGLKVEGGVKDPDTGKIKLWESDDELNEKFKEVCQITKAFLGGKKPRELSAEEFSDLAGLLDETDNPKAKAAVNLIIASRKERKYLERMLHFASEDMDPVVRSCALLAMYNFRDVETLKGMMKLLGYPHPPININLIETMLIKLKNSNPENFTLLFDAIEAMLNDEWFLQEKENVSQPFKHIMNTINKILQTDRTSNINRSKGLWWLVDRNEYEPRRPRMRMLGLGAAGKQMSMQGFDPFKGQKFCPCGTPYHPIYLHPGENCKKCKRALYR